MNCSYTTKKIIYHASGKAISVMETFKPDFIFLYARGRRIPHTDLFLIPNYTGDVRDRFFNALENFQESPQMPAKKKTGRNGRCDEAFKVFKICPQEFVSIISLTQNNSSYIFTPREHHPNKIYTECDIAANGLPVRKDR